MAEIKVARIKSLYAEAKGYLESIDKNSAVGVVNTQSLGQ